MTGGEGSDRPEAGVPSEPEGPELARAVLARARASARSGSRTGAGGRAAGRRGRRPSAPAVRGQDWSGAADDRRDPQPVADAVDGLVGEHGWGEDLAVRGVLARWDLLVGPDVAAHCRVESFDDGLLVVRTDSTAWATQVRLLTPHLLARLAADVGDGVVAEVVVRGPAAPSWTRGPRRVPGRGPRDTYG